MTHKNLDAFNAGYSCGKYGADMINCHFRHFATPEQKDAWECGKVAAELESKT